MLRWGSIIITFPIYIFSIREAQRSGFFIILHTTGIVLKVSVFPFLFLIPFSPFSFRSFYPYCPFFIPFHDTGRFFLFYFDWICFIGWKMRFWKHHWRHGKHVWSKRRCRWEECRLFVQITPLTDDDDQHKRDTRPLTARFRNSAAPIGLKEYEKMRKKHCTKRRQWFSCSSNNENIEA